MTVQDPGCLQSWKENVIKLDKKYNRIFVIIIVEEEI